jgi:hypothetical protein
MSYLQISKKLHLSPSTCFKALERYKQNGNRYVYKRLTNWSKAWATNRKIKGADKEFLLSPKMGWVLISEAMSVDIAGTGT